MPNCRMKFIKIEGTFTKNQTDQQLSSSLSYLFPTITLSRSSLLHFLSQQEMSPLWLGSGVVFCSLGKRMNISCGIIGIEPSTQ